MDGDGQSGRDGRRETDGGSRIGGIQMNGLYGICGIIMTFPWNITLQARYIANPLQVSVDDMTFILSLDDTPR